MKKKKAIALLVGLFVVICLPLSVWAIDYQVDPSQRVYDYANLFTDLEKQVLVSDAHILSQKHQMDFVIVTIADDENFSSQNYAQDFYDYNDFLPDGLLLLINMDIRELWICGTGTGKYIFHDGQIENILSDIYPYASNNDFYQTASQFLKSADQIEIRVTESSFSRNLRRIPFFLLAGAVIAGVSLAFMVSANKLRRIASEASAYERDGGLYLTYQQDTFSHSTVTRTPLQTNSNSSSRGGGHIGSSGRSHSGGGRSF